MIKKILTKNIINLPFKNIFTKTINTFSTLALGEHNNGNLRGGVFTLLSAAN